MRYRGQFLEHAVRSLAVGLAADDAALGIRRAGVVTDHLQAERVDRGEVARNVRGHHWYGGRHLVQVLARRMAAEQCIVVADAEDPAGQGHVRPGGEGLQLLHDIVHGIDRAVRWCEQVGADGLRAELLGVRMTVDEPGHQRLAAEVLHHRSVALLPERVRLAADERDPAVVHDDRLDGDGQVALHRDDGAAGDNEVRGRAGSGVGGLLAAGGHCEGGNEDGGNSLVAGHAGFLGSCRAKDRRRG